MTPLRSLLVALFVIASPCAAIADPGATDADQRLQDAGWTIDHLEIAGADRPGVRHLTVSGRFRLPADRVWRAIAYEDETDWPGIDQGTVEYQNGDTTIACYKIAVPVFKDRRYRLRIVNDDASMREDFYQVPGYGNVKTIDGTWKVMPLSDKITRVDYILYTDPGVKLIPGFIINWATRRMVPGVYGHIYMDATSDAARLGAKSD
jgi:hypothetical protein